MKKIKRLCIVLIVLGMPVAMLGQYMEVEPNDSRQQANELSFGSRTLINANFAINGDVDFLAMDWQQDCMYYLTSVENAAGVSPNLELYLEGNPNNLLTSNVGGRNGSNNFRLSGFVPKTSGRYYARVINAGASPGAYKVRMAGGRKPAELIVHEPDNTMAQAAAVNVLAEADTVYGAIYPANDIDYYRISGKEGNQFIIGTMPILDLDVRDTDSYIKLLDELGVVVAENDDVGSIITPSGSINCTFSRMTGVFPHSGEYYVAVRSFYNTNFGVTISEANPPMGEYGVYYLTAKAEPPQIAARYPHIEIPTTNSVLVQWNTPTPEKTVLLWGETKACNQVIEKSDLVQEHLVKISGLQPESKYYYRVVMGLDSTQCEFFNTAKPATTKNVKFFVISDSSPYEGFGSSPAQLQVAEQIQKKEYDFGLHCGDINQHIGEEYDLVYYQPYKNILKNATIFPCIGNHDTVYDNTRTYQRSFDLPFNNPDSTERYYSFNYGNVHVISLDTDSPYDPSSSQYKWLVQDLDSRMRKETMWTFIIFHKPPYSEGWPGYPGEMNVRFYLVPLFEKHGVDMVFNGHTHNYERGLLNGVYYIITGGGGAPLEDGSQAYDYGHVTVRVNEHHFSYIQINDDQCTLQAINKEGQQIDEVNIQKTASGVNEASGQEPESIPGAYHLYPNFPNPFNSSTHISFDIKASTFLHLTIHDRIGRSVRTLVTGQVNSGSYTVDWDGLDDAGETAATGIYFIKFETPEYSRIHRAVLLK